jgi:hypothetical protein
MPPIKDAVSLVLALTGTIASVSALIARVVTPTAVTFLPIASEKRTLVSWPAPTVMSSRIDRANPPDVTATRC